VTPLVFVGAVVAGAFGAVLRAEIVDASQRRLPGAAGRARGTAAVNLLGTLLLAVILAIDLMVGIDAAVLIIVGIGLCGSVTTFSGWVVDAVRRSSSAPLRAVGQDVVLQALVGIGLVVVILRGS
jgi:fluoride exporter